MSRKRRPYPSPYIIGHHNYQKSFHMGTNDVDVPYNPYILLYLLALIFNPYGEVWRAQLANPLSSPPRWGPWDLLRSVQMLKRERGMQKAMGSYHTYSSLVKLQLWFLSLQWKTCSLGASICSERPALGQNTDDAYCLIWPDVMRASYRVVATLLTCNIWQTRILVVLVW